ncbi:MAG TPA: response regulator [Fimbriimonadaceae bacterium]|nr:response regulator [Fimbriimonadaceae bacterium]
MKILVCDDERHIVRLLQLNLERQGYEVVCAYDGAEAIRNLESQDFDAAVIDLVMPIHDGVEVLQWVRENRPNLRIAILSEQADKMRVREDLPHHPDIWVTKENDLWSWLKEWL